MQMTEYTEKRANALNKMVFPYVELPINLKVLWINAGAKTYLNSAFRKQPHKHTFFELHFVMEGSVSYTCGHDVFTLDGGRALMIPPNTVHYYSPSADALKMTLAFSADEEALRLLQLKGRSVTCICYSDKIAQCLNFILRHSEISDLFTSQMIMGRALEILYSCFRAFGIKIPKNSNHPQDARFFAAQAYIKNNIDKKIACEDVSGECCLSVKQLNRIFKTETGESLRQYMNDAKINHAKRLLLDTRHSVKEIGFSLGFDNESNFVSFFRRNCGVPPGAFRNEMLKTEPKAPDCD